jgi:hypothetical protein
VLKPLVLNIGKLSRLALNIDVVARWRGRRVRDVVSSFTKLDYVLHFLTSFQL